MSDNTINNDMTMGGADGALLAGRYRVVRQLGQGGMGSVWLAEDTKLDGFKVAIKMLPSVLVNNKRAYQQVKAEALVSLKLSHSNIVTVRAFEEEGGSPFLVMDYIDGQTLDDYLAEKGKLTEEETIKLLKPVAMALDYAHSQGVVHRDVKPGNVMIRKDGTPFVLDFGIAREIQETMTRVTGKLSSGTLLYMSPEQLRGDMPAPAQDVYSFAAMAYECLTGNPPFARGQIEYQIEHVEPTPLGPQFANCGPGVMAGLEKKPENRPASCTAVLASSRGNGGGRSPRPTPASRQEAPRAPARTAGGKGLVVGLIVALALAGAGAYHYISVKNAERRRLSEAQVTFERALTSLNEYERKIEKLSREDGFGSRIDEINEKIPSRNVLKDVSSFLSAAERCADLEKECRQLLTADEFRIQAKTVRGAAQQARQKAQGQYASQDAKQTWQAAEFAYEQGRREFSQFHFERAVQSFTLSGQHYEKAASEAAAAREERRKAELARQEQKAKDEELRKKNEKEIADLRAACMAAKKAADDAEASEFASKEMSEALKLLADADNVSGGDRKQAYQSASNAFERARQVAMEASKPKVTLKAMLNGEEVNATVTSGLKDKTRKTPITVDLSGLKIGSSCKFECEYSRDGVPYKGEYNCTVKKGKDFQYVHLFVDRSAYQDSAGSIVVRNKMSTILIPSLHFAPPGTISDVVEFFRQASLDYDRPDIPLSQRGISIVLENKEIDGTSSVKRPISVVGRTLSDALRIICDECGFNYTIQNGIVHVKKKGEFETEGGYTVAQQDVVRSALLPYMWVEKWENGRVAICGRTSILKKQEAEAAARNGGRWKTAPELVVNALRQKAAVDAGSVKIASMSSKDVVGFPVEITEFTLEIKFK